MQICKPQSLGISSRPIEYRKRFGLCLSGCLHVPFAQAAAGTLWGEQSMWNFLAREMAVPLIDEGVSKLTPEFLVCGHAFPASEQPNACAVRARLGATEKTLFVFGDRFWSGEQASEPLPFERMPLDWTHAYGGTDVPANPAGRGRPGPDGVMMLPNIESPQARWLGPDQPGVPAAFAALDTTHPTRAAWRGTYDADWLQAHSPGFPPDLDWKYFNMAPRDQWLSAPLRGDEPWSLEHMHPTRTLIEGVLPGLRVRMFANYLSSTGGYKLREVPMRMTTVWFFPHAERAVLVFQGMAEVGEDDGGDIAHLMGAVERLGEARDDAHYASALERRLDPVEGGLHALNDSDLLPDGLDTHDPEFEQALSNYKSDGLQAEVQMRAAQVDMQIARDQATALGKDPDALGLKLPQREPSPTIAQLPAYLKAKRQEVDAQQLALLEAWLPAMERAFDAMERGKIDLAQLMHRGPPTFRAEAQLDKLRKTVAVSALPPIDLLAAQLRQQEVMERLGYLQTAHTQPRAHPLDKATSTVLRHDLQLLVASGVRMLAGIDLTGADLSHLDLRGIDFSGAWMESVDLRGANLSGAKLGAAVLAHADMRGSIAVGASFARANLGRARLGEAVLDNADLSGAVLSRCNLAKTQLRRAVIVGALMEDTEWGQADWTGLRAPGHLFYRHDMTQMTLAGAELANASFIECALTGADLQEAQMAGANFIGCAMDGVRMRGAHLAGAVFDKGTTLVGADLSQSNLTNVNFGEVRMERVLLVRAVLDGANLGRAHLDHCDARLASAKGALLRKAGLVKARLGGIDLRDAILQQADLRGADLRRANLFGADLSRVWLDGVTRFDGALITRARTWPRWTSEQQAGRGSSS